MQLSGNKLEKGIQGKWTINIYRLALSVRIRSSYVTQYEPALILQKAAYNLEGHHTGKQIGFEHDLRKIF